MRCSFPCNPACLTPQCTPPQSAAAGDSDDDSDTGFEMVSGGAESLEALPLPVQRRVAALQALQQQSDVARRRLWSQMLDAKVWIYRPGHCTPGGMRWGLCKRRDDCEGIDLDDSGPKGLNIFRLRDTCYESGQGGKINILCLRQLVSNWRNFG